MCTFLLKLLLNVTCFEIKEPPVPKLYTAPDKTVLCLPIIDIATLPTQKGMEGQYSLC